MKVTKLDSYDYIVLPGIVRVFLTSQNDPDLVDIMSEIQNSNGKIHIDGAYYMYLDDYEIVTKSGETYVSLKVVELDVA
jgi:hypothetical protein